MITTFCCKCWSSCAQKLLNFIVLLTWFKKNAHCPYLSASDLTQILLLLLQLLQVQWWKCPVFKLILWWMFYSSLSHLFSNRHFNHHQLCLVVLQIFGYWLGHFLVSYFPDFVVADAVALGVLRFIFFFLLILFICRFFWLFFVVLFLRLGFIWFFWIFTLILLTILLLLKTVTNLWLLHCAELVTYSEFPSNFLNSGKAIKFLAPLATSIKICFAQTASYFPGKKTLPIAKHLKPLNLIRIKKHFLLFAFKISMSLTALD